MKLFVKTLNVYLILSLGFLSYLWLKYFIYMSNHGGEFGDTIFVLGLFLLSIAFLGLFFWTYILKRRISANLFKKQKVIWLIIQLVLITILAIFPLIIFLVDDYNVRKAF